MHLIACSDDYYFNEPCGVYVSRIEEAALGVGTHYIVVDGYGNDSGNYVIAVNEYVECVIPCPVGGVPEGEPPLVTNYVDSWNAGCDTDPGHPFQAVTGDADGQRTLCGVAGWYLVPDPPYNWSHRDTDWFMLAMGVTGAIDVVADAESSTYIRELLPQDCEAVAVVQTATAGDCQVASMTIDGYAPGADGLVLGRLHALRDSARRRQRIRLRRLVLGPGPGRRDRTHDLVQGEGTVRLSCAGATPRLAAARGIGRRKGERHAHSRHRLRRPGHAHGGHGPRPRQPAARQGPRRFPRHRRLSSSRQGGDTIVTAFTIPSLPFADTGTTTGYSDDYDEICPI